MLEKIVVRKKIVPNVFLRIVHESKETEEICDVIGRLGRDGMLTSIFEEEKPESIFKEYEAFLKEGESPYFSWMYVVCPDYGVVLDSHITLYRYDQRPYNDYRNDVPWVYPDRERYLGDTWWSDDEEILEDSQNLSVVEFFKKYKGC